MAKIHKRIMGWIFSYNGLLDIRMYKQETTSILVILYVVRKNLILNLQEIRDMAMKYSGQVGNKSGLNFNTNYILLQTF